MNQQKIKELVLATGLVEYDWREDMKYNSSDELVERLIEVVVRECLVILNQNNPRPPGTVILYSMDQDQHFDTGWQVAVETKQARIKQHFGVEE